MQYKALTLSAFAATALAQSPSQSEDPLSLLSVLQTALPSSLVAEALTNSAAVASQISSEFAAGNTPTWYSALPSDIQTYLVPPMATNTAMVTGGAMTNSTGGAMTNGTMAAGNGTMTNGTITTTNANGGVMTITPGAVNPTSSGSSSNSGSSGNGGVSGNSGNSGSNSNGDASSSQSGNNAAPTAFIGAGLAGAVGLVGLLAL